MFQPYSRSNELPSDKFDANANNASSTFGAISVSGSPVIPTRTVSPSSNTHDRKRPFGLNKTITGITSPPIGVIFAGNSHNHEFAVWGNQPSVRSHLLHQASIGQTEVVLLGRLYYCEDWLSRLQTRVSSPTLKQSKSNHALLALNVYLELGEQQLSKLEGDFALICCDEQHQRVIATRDQGGGYQLFWRQTSEGLLISTAIEPIRRLQSLDQLNLSYVSDFLILPGACFDEVPTNETIWEGINRVERGTRLNGTLDDSLSVKIIRQPAAGSFTNLASDSSLEECSEVFLNQLKQSVKERLDQITFAQVSGGFDSTLCAALASRLQRSANGPVHGVSMVYQRHSGLAVEQPYIDAAYLSCPNLVRHDVLGDEVLDFDEFEPTQSFGEPYPYLAHLPMELAMIREASNHGAKAMLSGSGGDGVATIPIPVIVANLLCNGELKEAIHGARAFGSTRSVSACRLLFEGFRMLMPFTMWNGWRPFIRGGRASWERQTDWTIPPWIRSRYARQFFLRDRIQDIHKRINGEPSLSPLQHYHHGLRSGGRVNFARWYHAAEAGILVSHPFLDQRLITLAESIHWRCRVIPGQQKPLLASAAKDLLPAKIRNRRGKGHFDELYYRGLARHRLKLEALINSSSPLIDEVIDISKLMNCLRKASLGAATDIRATDRLNLTLSLLNWLSSR